MAHFFSEIGLRTGIPATIVAKFERAQKLHVCAWFDADLIKAGELVALAEMPVARSP